MALSSKSTHDLHRNPSSETVSSQQEADIEAKKQSAVSKSGALKRKPLNRQPGNRQPKAILHADGFSISVDIELTRLTNMMTGCFNPSLAPDGKHLLFSAYQNGKYDVYIMEISKTIEEKIEVSKRGRTLCNFNGGGTRQL